MSQKMLTFNGSKILGADKPYDASCRVRTVENGLRTREQVLLWNGRPYMPTTFPKGIHKIVSVEWVPGERSLYWPVIIRTDAFNKVYYWTIKDGKYDRQTEAFCDDGYLIHHARYVDSAGVMRLSSTTHGCIAVADPQRMVDLGRWTEAQLKLGTELFLEVI